MIQSPQQPIVGIDDLSAYIPQIYLPIEDLATARNLNYGKLSKGLGLLGMAIADAQEDTATMAANAVLDLIHKNDLAPQDIGRIYLGTESALDGAKPTATYVLEMLQDHFSDMYGPNCFLHCDVIDMTFACIGAIDALHNTLEWVANGKERIGIVVASDDAKYELGSGGEYTQGAGAVAALVRQNPRLLSIDPDFGVATRPVHDFYKPIRKVGKRELIEEVAKLLPGVDETVIDFDALVKKLGETIEVKGILDCNEAELSIHKVTPIFDGPYSNDCYQARIREALMDYRQKAGLEPGHLIADWNQLIFHLPYAFQARRMFSELFMEELKAVGNWEVFIDTNGLSVPCADGYEDREKYITACSDFLRQVTKTTAYQEFVADKIAPGEWASSHVGNLYAGSIFLSLMSSLEWGLQSSKVSEGQQFGLFAYGSGSKSKVTAATVQPGWQAVVQEFGLQQRLNGRQAIDYTTYEQLHRGLVTHSIASHQGGSFFLADVHEERDETEGVRHYGYRAAETTK